MGTKIKNPLRTKKNLFAKSDKRTIRRMARYGIGYWSELTKPIIRSHLESLGIGGEGFCDFIEKGRLPVGAGCVLGCILQRDVEVVKMTALFFFKKDQASVWLEGFYKGETVGRQKFILASPMRLEEEVRDMAGIMKATLESDRKRQAEQ